MKKLFKNSYIALAVLALGFSACTEEVEYTPAEVPVNEQVYFSNTNGAQIDLAKDAKSFDIAVSRAEAGEAASIDVIATADSLANTIFEFPTTVEFADSATNAVYTVTVKDNVELEFGKFHNITLAFDESLTTPYGNASYSFTVGVPEPWSEWAEYKAHPTGAITFTQYFNGTYSDITVDYREYQLDKTIVQFRFNVSEIGGPDLIVDCNMATGACQVKPVQQATTHSTYGPVFVSDLVNYPFIIRDDNDNPIEFTYEDYPCFYNAETGLFTLNLIYYVDARYGSAASGYFSYGVETFQFDGFKQYDYSLAMQYKGQFIDSNSTSNAVISATKGADVSQFLMTVVAEGTDLNATVSGMLDGTVACDTLTESGFYAYPMTESGNYTALAITFDAEGNAQEAYSEEFEFYLAGEENPWVSLGLATYTEDCLTTFFDVANETYNVEVRQNKDNPGLYRIINPYASWGADTSKEYYIEIDATDPEGVYIPNVYNTGLDVGYGEISITCMAYYYMATQGVSLEDVKDGGYCGIFADNVITFPKEALMISMASYQDGAWYKSNVNGAFKLDMSNMQPIGGEEENGEAAEAPAARMNAERKLKNVEGGFKFGIRAKKIDNSFMTPVSTELK